MTQLRQRAKCVCVCVCVCECNDACSGNNIVCVNVGSVFTRLCFRLHDAFLPCLHVLQFTHMCRALRVTSVCAHIKDGAHQAARKSPFKLKKSQRARERSCLAADTEGGP